MADAAKVDTLSNAELRAELTRLRQEHADLKKAADITSDSGDGRSLVKLPNGELFYQAKDARDYERPDTVKAPPAKTAQERSAEALAAMQAAMSGVFATGVPVAE